MQGLDIYNRAMNLLGYTGENGGPSNGEALAMRGKELINQLLCDFGDYHIEFLSDEISVSKEVFDALCCGTAMLISLAEGDAGKNAVFAKLYEAKRAKALSSVSIIEDRLPKEYMG